MLVADQVLSEVRERELIRGGRGRVRENNMDKKSEKMTETERGGRVRDIE